MKSVQSWSTTGSWVLGAVPTLMLPAAAHAYIDPNTGGLLFQILAPILAIITSAWLFLRDFIRSIWHRATARFRKAHVNTGEPAESAPASGRDDSGKTTV